MAGLTPYAIAFFAGLAGSVHCLGMCGGFACMLGAGGGAAMPALARQLLYNLGRVASYCFLGAAVGHGGMWLARVGLAAGTGEWTQRVLAGVSGVLIIAVGLQFLGWLRHARVRPLARGAGTVAGALRRIAGAPGPAAPLAFGLANGLLPCPLVYAMVAQAGACGSALGGLQLMVAFGLGTFPAMLAIGALGQRWQRPAGVLQPARGLAWRARGVRLAGALVLLLGVVTLARGLLPVAGHVALH